jgi:pentatricopeptide repeat protein
MGMLDRAVNEFEQAVALSHGQGSVADLAHALARAGRVDRAWKLLAELKKASAPAAYQIALVYAGLGEETQALNWLETAVEQHSNLNLMTVNVEQRFDAVGSTPRFAELVRRVGLSPKLPHRSN